MIRRLEGYDPSSLDGRTIPFQNEKDARAKARTALLELRGEQEVKVKPNGASVVVRSGCGIKPAEDIHAVPIINRTTGEVRHLDLGEEYRNGGGNASAENQMRMLFDGVWRLATAQEQKAALEKWAAERAAVKAEQERALTMPADRIGQAIGEKLNQFAEQISGNKKAATSAKG